MFLPIGDENPRERTPYVNYALLAINVAVGLLFCVPGPSERVVEIGALIPARPEWHAFFSSMFLHAGLLHLAGNMLFLWIFGDNVEDRLGHLGYAVFYLASGLAAGAAHVLTTAHPELPTLGASGAVSGVLGAYVVFFPRHRVRMLLWFFFYAEVFRIPAFWWIGFWALQQVVMHAVAADGGVAYAAHLGGFGVGFLVAGLVRVALGGRLPRLPLPESLRGSSRSGPSRRPVVTLDEEPAVVFLDEPGQRWCLLRLDDELPGLAGIGEAVGLATGESPDAVERRLQATRGMIARGLDRAAAERLQRELRRFGLNAALALDHPTNRPPDPARVEAVAWDDESLRLRVLGETIAVPWSAPFLYVGARVGGEDVIDVFVNRRAAFRIADKAAFEEGDLERLARAVVEYRQGAVLNEGVRVLAGNGAWGWLAFRQRSDYDDYLFWLYNLVLSRVPLHRG